MNGLERLSEISETDSWEGEHHYASIGMEIREKPLFPRGLTLKNSSSKKVSVKAMRARQPLFREEFYVPENKI